MKTDLDYFCDELAESAERIERLRKELEDEKDNFEWVKARIKELEEDI